MTIGTINDTGAGDGDWVLIHPLHKMEDFCIPELPSFLGKAKQVVEVGCRTSTGIRGYYPLLKVDDSGRSFFFVGTFLIKVHPDKIEDKEYLQQLADFHTELILSRVVPELPE